MSDINPSVPTVEGLTLQENQIDVPRRFAFMPGPLQEYLLKSLQDASYKPSELGVTNYNEMDDWYYAYINQYKSNPELYNQLLNNNPHTVGNSGLFSPTLGDNIASMFGSTAAEDRYYNQLRSDAVEWVANLVDKYNNRAYDSALSQVARQSAAGINVDLNGGQGISPGDPGSSSLAERDSVLPTDVADAASSDSLNLLQAVSTGVTTAISSTLNAIQSINQFQLQQNEIASSELNGLTSAESWFTDMLKTTIRYDYSKGYSAPEWNQALSDAIVSITESDEFNRLNRRTRRYVKNVVSNFDVNNLKSKGLYESLLNDYLTTREKNVRIKAHPSFSESFSEWMENLTPIMKEYNEAELADYLSRKKNPSLMDSQIFHNNASARHANASSDLIEYRKQKIETIGTLFDNIKASIPKDEWWHGLAEWFTEMSRIMTIQALIRE